MPISFHPCVVKNVSLSIKDFSLNWHYYAIIKLIIGLLKPEEWMKVSQRRAEGKGFQAKQKNGKLERTCHVWGREMQYSMTEAGNTWGRRGFGDRGNMG